MTRRLLLSVGLMLAGLALAGSAQAPRRPRQVVVVVDGLRPDYVAAGTMPRLTALAARGVVFNNHHAVFPTVTRVNGASFATGAYPETHGLMGNSVYFPRVDLVRFLDTANRAALSRIAEVEGRLLTATTIGEVLKAAGQRMFVASSGSPGSAWLNDPTHAGGTMVHPEFAVPDTLSGDLAGIGAPPAGEGQAMARDRYVVDAFLKVGLAGAPPSVTVLWLGSLDATAHARGIGGDDALAVLTHLDTEIGRIEDGLTAAGLRDSTDIWVTSDHGFSTHTGAVDVAALLKPFARNLPDGTPRLIAGSGAIYVRDGDTATTTAIVEALQGAPGIGAVFTTAAVPGGFDGRVPGTLSFDVARWQHARSAHVLYSPDWSDAANAAGVKGSVRAGGVAGHGSSSPWDVHNTLIAAGPSLQRGLVIDTPSANVDVMPTLATLLALRVPASVQGRPLTEAFADAGARRSVATRAAEHIARTPDGAYAVTARMSIVTVGDRAYRYFDGTTVARRAPR